MIEKMERIGSLYFIDSEEQEAIHGDPSGSQIMLS